MNEDKLASANADIESTEEAGAKPPPSTGVVRRVGAAELRSKPSWEEVDEYLREGRHGEHVERFARESPDFADVLRAMRNDLEHEQETRERENGWAGAVILPFRAQRRPSERPPEGRAPEHAR